MERFGMTWPVMERSPRADADAFVLPSRRTALDACLGGLAAGPVLITGEAGIGKTWLAGRVAAEAADPGRWIAVDLTPTLDVAGLFRAIGHHLGMDAPQFDRLALADALADEAAEGRRWGLVLDEAHTAPVEVLEDVRILMNGLGQPGGFAAMILVGQTALNRRLRQRALAALASRLAGRVHLRSIDVDEAGVLIDRLAPGRALDSASLERCHRDAEGIPRRLLNLATAEPGRVPRPVASVTIPGTPPIEPGRPFDLVTGRLDPGPIAAPAPPNRPAIPDERAATEPPARGDDRPEPAPFEPFQVRTLFGAERPPLAVDDGMIEVGWEADPASAAVEEDRGETDCDAAEPSGTEDPPPPSPVAVSERLADHYAALQAWEEWAQNQGPSPDGHSNHAEAGLATTELPRMAEPDDPGNPAGPERTVAGRPNLWADDQHEFAPYSQLFSRIQQSRDSEG